MPDHQQQNLHRAQAEADLLARPLTTQRFVSTIATAHFPDRTRIAHRIQSISTSLRTYCGYFVIGLAFIWRGSSKSGSGAATRLPCRPATPIIRLHAIPR